MPVGRLAAMLANQELRSAPGRWPDTAIADI